MSSRAHLSPGFLSVLLCATCQTLPVERTEVWDVVVYGGTSSGVVAAAHAASLGRRTILIEPTRHVGGMSSSGLGATDSGEKRAIGGRAREFYAAVRAHYAHDAVWRRESRADYGAFPPAPADAMWRFEPHVAEAIFDDWLDSARVTVLREERLDRTRRLGMDAREIATLPLASGRSVTGRMFIDASYEGDLMAAARVSYRVGREGCDEYDETLNGVQTQNAKYHQFVPGVDPYRVPGDPASGLLPGVHADEPGVEGSEDKRLQAYCFRLCLTDDPKNQVRFKRPADYDAARYELLLRNFEAGADRVPWNSIAMPNRKTDTNNNRGFSTDHIGANYDYPEADDATRAAIVADHESYQRGLLWTLANDARVPPAIRAEVARWGLACDEFVDNDNWPYLLYVREARRMCSDYVVTEHDCFHRTEVRDPVGLGAYNMDSHHVQRYVDDHAQVRNEGDVQVAPAGPYPISYRAIVPSAGECPNLLVPVCLSASHIAYGSIRMEPVFMILGQSAADAAHLALDLDLPVQEVPYERLRERLEIGGQILAWSVPSTASAPRGIELESVEGIVCDDENAQLEGTWIRSTSVGPFLGRGYRHDDNGAKGAKLARFPLGIPRRGSYRVQVAYQPHGNRSTSTPLYVDTADARRQLRLDQTLPPGVDGLWTELGTYELDPGTAAVTVETSDTAGYVIIDAVRALPAD